MTLTATAVVMFAGGPGDVGGPSSAVAITQALRWFGPPAGTVLHVRSVETQGGRTTTREIWQSADDAERRAREVLHGPNRYETPATACYDPATDTIYAGDAAAVRPSTTRPEPIVGDPVVRKVRYGLQERFTDGHRSGTARGARRLGDRPAARRGPAGDWKIWVSAADGKPLELRDPGRDASEAPSTIRWPTYEVLGDRDADELLTLAGAHPTATVIRDSRSGRSRVERVLGTKAHGKR